MSDVAGLSEIEKRLVEAKCGSDELSGLVAIGADIATEANPKNPAYVRHRDGETGQPDDMYCHVQPYSESIDAALALVERVMPQWQWLLRSDEQRGSFCNLTGPDWTGVCLSGRGYDAGYLYRGLVAGIRINARPRHLPCACEGPQSEGHPMTRRYSFRRFITWLHIGVWV